MNTYNPNNYNSNQTEQFQGQEQYSNQYQNNNTYQYNNTYYAGDNQSINPNSFMDMNSGFEAGAQPMMSGLQNLGAIVAQEVVAKSFLFMFVALLITAFASLTTSPMVAFRMVSGSGFFVLFIVELIIVMVANWAVKKNIPVLAGVMLAAYSWITGMLLSVIYLAYTGGSIVSVFFITAGLFAVMAIYGMVTGKDLTSVGNLCLMGLLGIILAGLANIFLRNSMVDLITCVLGVIIFVGLTAYDAQKIKRLAATSDSSNVLSLAMYGALELYLDFINLFLKLLRLMGKRK